MDPINLYKEITKQHQQKKGSVKSNTEVLGGSQILLGVSYDIQDVFGEIFFKIDTQVDLSSRLKSDASLRKIYCVRVRSI